MTALQRKLLYTKFNCKMNSNCFLVLAMLLIDLVTAQMPNNITYNGIGSTPAARHYVSQCQAQNIINYLTGVAFDMGVYDSIAITDPSGLLVGFIRMDNAFPGGIDLAIKKAKTVCLFNGLTTVQLYPAATGNGTLIGLEETNGGLVIFPGGLPMYEDGCLIGAIGVSGGTTDEDVAVAQAGIDHLATLGNIC